MTRIAALWCALVAFGACNRGDGEIPVEFEPFVPDLASLEKALVSQQKALLDWHPEGELAELVNNYRTFNLQLAAGQGLDEAFEKLLARVQKVLAQVPAEKSPGEDAVRLVYWITEKYQEAFDRVIEKCPADCARAVCSSGEIKEEWRPALVEFIAWAGDFLPHACRSALIQPGDKGFLLTAEARYLMRAAFKMRLAGLFNALSSERDASPLFLHPEEQKLYFRWVAERSPGADWQRKLQAVVELKRLDQNYPLALARGIIHYQAGYYEAAVADFEFAASENPGHARLPSWLAQARRKAAMSEKKKEAP
jgi:hypothetical protein